METERQERKKLLRRVAAGVVLVVGAVLGFVVLSSGGKDAVQDEAAFTVREGPLTLSFSESGSILAREQVVLKNEVEGKTALLWLVEEGTRVKKGDLLAELDASRLKDEEMEQQIKVQNAEAAFIHARENLEVVRNQAKSDKVKSEFDYRLAKEDVVKYREGEFPKELKEVEARITLARGELSRAERDLEWSRVLFKEKYLSESELQADELAAKKARLELELAQSARNLLKSHADRRKRAELEIGVKQARMALDRSRRKGAADVIQAEADLQARRSELEREKVTLAGIRSQLEKTKIRAPVDGLVVYASSVEDQSTSEPLAEGQEVRERQELFYLPAEGSVMVQVKVHESHLDKVRVGLPVRVTVDALPGRVYAGKVASIAFLPDAASIWLNPDLKVYNTQIHLDGETAGLRTGMSCRAEIVVEDCEKATYCPVQSVRRVNGRPTVYRIGEEGVEAVPVQIGLDNNRMVKVERGLHPGDRILLNPPLVQGESAGEGGDPDDRRAPAGEGK